MKTRTASGSCGCVMLQESIVPELHSRENRRLEGPPAEMVRSTTRAGWVKAGHIVRGMVANARKRDKDGGVRRYEERTTKVRYLPEIRCKLR
jgi:hypothetical protein